MKRFDSLWQQLRLQHSIRAIAWFFLALLLLAYAPAVSALDPDQKAVYKEQVFGYDIKDANFCGGTSTAGSIGSTSTSTATITTDLASFVDAYGQVAFDVGKANGIPYDAILAQASLESGNGASQLTKQANNFFGIKAGANWTGPTVTMRTAEQTSSGSVYYVNAQFEAYPSPQAGFQGYVDFLKRNSRYADAFNHQHDPVGYFQSLKNAGYATDVSYVSKLTARLTAVQNYIAGKGVLPPESQVTYDVPQGGGGGGTTAASSGTSGTPAAAACTSSSDASGTSGGSVVQVALQELAAWKAGGQSYTKYTSGRPEDWCADFVSWVYKQAGRPFTPTPGVPMLDGWQIPSVNGVEAYLKAKGQFWDKASGPPPQPGDIIIHKNGESHTNLVVEANGYMVTTVGGNEAGGGTQGPWYATSKVNETGPFDIRQDSTVTGWGRLP